jgi:hypothetical protein
LLALIYDPLAFAPLSLWGLCCSYPARVVVGMEIPARIPPAREVGIRRAVSAGIPWLE